jgi:hypothetical protein
LTLGQFLVSTSALHYKSLSSVSLPFGRELEKKFDLEVTDVVFLLYVVDFLCGVSGVQATCRAAVSIDAISHRTYCTKGYDYDF